MDHSNSSRPPHSSNNDDLAQSSRDSFQIHRHPQNPCGPHLLECLKSDANSARWPSVGPVIDSKGVSCQWVVSQSAFKSKWLASLGKNIAEMLGLSKKSQKEDWKLKDFPNNYQLYTYIKGTREDQYLFGSTHVYKFRTSNEFLPHLQWLASDGTKRCLCKYCSGAKNQLEVNMALGLSNGLSNSMSAFKSIKSLNHSSDRAIQPRRSNSPPKKNQVYSPFDFQGPYLNEELNRDLLENRSNFRKHELVWCLITDLVAKHSPERGSRNENDLEIKFWPGLCEDMILCTESRAFISIDDDEEAPIVSSGNLSKRKLEQSAVSPHKSFKNEFETFQKYKWKIRLLSLSDIVIREEVQILPWLFKTVDLKQKYGMKKRPGMSLPQHVRDSHRSIRPKLDSFINSDERLVAFQLALQTAANLEEFWVAHDRYDAYPDICTSEKLPKMPNRTSQDESISHLPTIWFQGIWWGAEKIWLHDVVRLNDFKQDLALAFKLKTPRENQEKSPPAIKNRECYFLKIEGIYRDEREKRLIVMGKIFDLVQSTTQVPLISPSSINTKNNDKPRFKRSRKWMPDPPTGYEFRQITKPKEMIHLHVECISGRFYPPTRKNQCDKFSEISRRLAPKVSQDDPKFNSSFPSPINPSYQYLPQEPEQSFNDPNLVLHNASLFGLAPGQRNFMKCRKWRSSRAECISEAEQLAEQEMIWAYEKLKLIDDSEVIDLVDNPHYTLKNHVTVNKNSALLSHKNPKEQNQSNVIVIEIDP